jgi:DNA-binding transcriptional LysR family regulator
VQLVALEREEFDGGFILHSPGLAPEGLPRLRVDSEPFTLALPEQHPLATAPTLRLRAVLVEPIVIFPRRLTPSLHDAVFALYHHAGCIPKVAQEALQMQTIVNLVSAGLGIAWVPSSVRQFRRAGVVYRDLRPGTGRSRVKLPECETSLVWTSRSGPAMERFVAFVKARHQEETDTRPAARLPRR